MFIDLSVILIQVLNIRRLLSVSAVVKRHQGEEAREREERPVSEYQLDIEEKCVLLHVLFHPIGPGLKGNLT